MDNQNLILSLNEAISSSNIRLGVLDFRKLQSLVGATPIQMSVKVFWGEDITVILPEYISCRLFLDEFFEKDLTKFIIEHLNSGMTFIDVGAHIGYFSLLSSVLVGNTGQVHSFEPTKDVFQILQKNCSNKENITMNSEAVFSKVERLVLNTYGLKWSAFNSLFVPRILGILSKVKCKRMEVQTTTLDQYCDDKHIQPDFIKIDAEKSELNILIGAEKTLKKDHPIISVESGDEENDAQIIDFMRALNYSYQKVLNSNLIFV